MPTPSPILQLPIPLGTEPADAPSNFQAFSDRLEKMLALSGLEADRPATATAAAHQLYYATDTGRIFFFDGIKWVEVASGTTTPPGTIAMFAGTPSWSKATPGGSPVGWLPCDGVTYLQADYPLLAAAVGAAYASGGDGSAVPGDRFRVPDMRSRAVVGAGTGAGLSNRARGARAGVEAVAISTAQMPSHAHSIADPGHAHLEHPGSLGIPGYGGVAYNAGGTGDAGRTGVAQMAYGAFATDARGTGIGIYPTGGGAAHDNMPPVLAVPYMIRAV